jgi:hypothetical protein
MKRPSKTDPKPHSGVLTPTSSSRPRATGTSPRRINTSGGPTSTASHNSTHSAPHSRQRRPVARHRGTGPLPAGMERPRASRRPASTGHSAVEETRWVATPSPTEETSQFQEESAVEDVFPVRERRARRGLASRVMKSWRKARRVTPREDNPFEHALDESGAVNLRLRGRRARKRIGATTLVCGLAASAFSLCLIVMTWAVLVDLRNWQGQVSAKQVQLEVLHEQLDSGRKRLAVLQSSKGREQLLHENGYIRPGDRILLFPTTPAENQDALPSPTDSATKPLVIENGSTSSSWRRAGDMLGTWWRELNR